VIQDMELRGEVLILVVKINTLGKFNMGDFQAYEGIL
jgi:hypothetical protein